MAKITNGRVVAEVSDEKAAHYCLMMGYKLVEEKPDVEIVEESNRVASGKAVPNEPSEPVRPKRGRPTKEVSND